MIRRCLIIPVAVFLFFLPGCDLGPSQGSSLSHLASGCGGFPESVAARAPGGQPESANVTITVEGSTISVLAENFQFNCCPREILTDLATEGVTFRISIDEAEAGCNCLCPYDINCSITGVSPGTYIIEVYKYFDHPLLMHSETVAVF